MASTSASDALCAKPAGGRAVRYRVQLVETFFGWGLPDWASPGELPLTELVARALEGIPPQKIVSISYTTKPGTEGTFNGYSALIVTQE